MLSRWGAALSGHAEAWSGMWFSANQERPRAQGIHPCPAGSGAGSRRDPAGIQSGVTLDWRGGSGVHPAGGGQGGGGIQSGANQEPPWAGLRSSREPTGKGRKVWRSAREPITCCLGTGWEPIGRRPGPACGPAGSQIGKDCGGCGDPVGSQSCVALGEARGTGQEPIRSVRIQ